MKRKPVPLRCDHCGEIIYVDQRWDEHDADYDTEAMPWHEKCWESEVRRREKQVHEHRRYIKDLKARPRESLNFEEAISLVSHEQHESMVDAIVGGGIDYFGPGSPK